MALESIMGSEHHDEPSLGIGLKVMLAAAFSLFGMVLLIIIFHFCAKYLIRRHQRRRHNEILHQIRTQITPIDVNSSEQFNNSGLDPLIIASLPKILYKQTDQFNQGEVIECSVCLGTILEDSITRVLPNCKHIFHVDCVDEWFGANTTCPICRTIVELMVQPGHNGHVATWVHQVEPTAPPVEGGDEPRDGEELEVRCTGLRIGSFHRMRTNSSRERSLRRTHSSGDSAIEDLEKALN